MVEDGRRVVEGGQRVGEGGQRVVEGGQRGNEEDDVHHGQHCQDKPQQNVEGDFFNIHFYDNIIDIKN